MHFIQGIFIDSNTNVSGMVLEPRSDYQSYWVLSALVLCLLLFSVARYFQPRLLPMLIQNTLLFQTSEEQIKNGNRWGTNAQIILFVNFLVVFGTAIVWHFTNKKVFENTLYLWYCAILPLAYFLIQVLFLTFTGWITSKKELVNEINSFSLNQINFLGLLFGIFVFVAYFFKLFFTYYISVIIIIYLIFLSIRFLRAFYLSITNNVRWYYIILYFWTLEILPILVVYRLVFGENLWEVSLKM